MKIKNLKSFADLESVNVLSVEKSQNVVGGKAASIVQLEDFPSIVVCEDAASLITIENLPTLAEIHDIVWTA